MCCGTIGTRPDTTMWPSLHLTNILNQTTPSHSTPGTRHKLWFRNILCSHSGLYIISFLVVFISKRGIWLQKPSKLLKNSDEKLPGIQSLVLWMAPDPSLNSDIYWMFYWVQSSNKCLNFVICQLIMMLLDMYSWC